MDGQQMHCDETLRLQFGTASNAIGAQLYSIEKLNDGHPGLHRSDGKPRVLAFEAKGRIQRKVSTTSAIRRASAAQEEEQKQTESWSGGIQVYDQAPVVSASASSQSSAIWNWGDFNEKNLVEIDEFRPYMPLHNVYEGQSVARDGRIATLTLDTIEDRLRGVLEECDNLKFVQNLVDMDSCWAGLSLEVLTYLNEECPSAVVASFGNDWTYPLEDQQDENLYSASGESRDKSKIAARRHINLVASVASLADLSSVFIPVALAPSSRRYKLGPSTNEELLGGASFAAASIEIAMSAFRTRACSSVYSLLEGILPSMKIMELSARFPFVTNPSLLISEANGGHSETEQLEWNHHSLLPLWQQKRSRAFEAYGVHAVKTTPPPRFRRIHFRGEFDQFGSMLQTAMDRFQPSGCVAQWTQEPLYLEHHKATTTSSGNSSSSTIEAVDAVSQLALSHGVGQFLSTLTTQTSRSDKRILYEFTQAGMNVDALEDFQATLRSWSDAYPRSQTAGNDESSEDEEDGGGGGEDDVNMAT